MKHTVYLRHAKTGMYYSGWHNWTSDIKGAFNFETKEQAVERARGEGLSQMEVVLRQEDAAQEIVMPIVEPRASRI